MNKKEVRKENQKRVYNQRLLNDLAAGLGTQGFAKIKTLKDLVVFNFIQKMALKKEDKVLDVGCNAGELLNKIVATYAVKGYGLDISDQTIKIARKYNPFGNDYIVADAEKIPYPDNYFEAVISTDVLEHVTVPEKCLDEMERVLKPGGRIFIYCISRRNFGTIRFLMQKFRHPHAWGDFGDHRQDYLVKPSFFRRFRGQKGTKIFYFHCFFSHFLDEFLIRPFLAFISRSKKDLDTKVNITKPKNQTGLSPKSKKMALYLFFLKAVYYFTLILDTPWRLLGLSDAILILIKKPK